jgi:hypothetical protein
MPDVLPSLLGLEVEVHGSIRYEGIGDRGNQEQKVQKIPRSYRKLTEDFGEIFRAETSMQQYHTVR